MTVHALIQRTGSSVKRVLNNDAQTTALFLKHAKIINLYNFWVFFVTSITIVTALNYNFIQ